MDEYPMPPSYSFCVQEQQEGFGWDAEGGGWDSGGGRGEEEGSVDIVALLIGIFGSKDVFVSEYRWVMGLVEE